MSVASSSMDVDTLRISEREEPTISVHPLAIVNMSDQYTRVTCGGSPLPRDAPVVGLLFGKASTTTTTTTSSSSSSNKSQQQQPKRSLQVTDADDIPTDSSEAAAIQVGLHQAVFPQHEVIGWYRVASASGGDNDGGGGELLPNAEDVALTQQLQQHYCSSASTGNSVLSRSFLFALLQAPSASASDGTADQKDEDDDDDLPLTLYTLHHPSTSTETAGAATSGSSALLVLRALEDWTLETSDAERIAVERVIREKDQTATSESSSGSNQTSCLPFFQSAQQELDHSLAAIDARLEILATFLNKTSNGTIPFHHDLVRQVHSLLLQINVGSGKGGASGSGTSATATSTTSVQQLAFLAKTVDAVYSYTEKFKLVHDSSSSSSGGAGGLSGSSSPGARHLASRHGDGRRY